MIKNLLVVTFIILVFTPNVKSQISYYTSIEKSNDTLSDLHYFKKLDNSIKEKLDSFLVFIKTKKKEYKQNNGFIELCLIKNSAGRIMVDLSLNTQYAHSEFMLLKEIILEMYLPFHFINQI